MKYLVINANQINKSAFINEGLPLSKGEVRLDYITSIPGTNILDSSETQLQKFKGIKTQAMQRKNISEINIADFTLDEKKKYNGNSSSSSSSSSSFHSENYASDKMEIKIEKRYDSMNLLTRKPCDYMDLIPVYNIVPYSPFNVLSEILKDHEYGTDEPIQKMKNYFFSNKKKIYSNFVSKHQGTSDFMYSKLIADTETYKNKYFYRNNEKLNFTYQFVHSGGEKSRNVILPFQKYMEGSGINTFTGIIDNMNLSPYLRNWLKKHNIKPYFEFSHAQKSIVSFCPIDKWSILDIPLNLNSHHIYLSQQHMGELFSMNKSEFYGKIYSENTKKITSNNGVFYRVDKNEFLREL